MRGSSGTQHAHPQPGVAVPHLVPLLVVLATAGYICRVDITVVAPQIKAAFGLSDVEIGKVFSAFLLGYTVMQVPSGWLADRISARRLFLTLAVMWTALTLATAAVGWRPLTAVSVLTQLLVIRCIFGVFAAPTYPGSGRTIAVFVAPPRQGRANGAVLASIGIGSAVTPPLLGVVIVHWGWRPALALAAAIAALAALLWGIWRPAVGWPTLVRGAAERRVGTTEMSGASPLRNRSFWFLAASYTLQGYVGYIFVFWFYLYLVQVRHFELLQAAWLTTLPWIGSLVAIPLGGLLSDLAVKRWGATWGRRLVPMPALIVAAGFLFVGAGTASATVAVASLTIATALVLASEGPFWATMTQISGARAGIGGGVMNFGSNLGGMISPVLTPWLAARLGWTPALSVAAALAVVAGLLWMGVRAGATNSVNPRG